MASCEGQTKVPWTCGDMLDANQLTVLEATSLEPGHEGASGSQPPRPLQGQPCCLFRLRALLAHVGRQLKCLKYKTSSYSIISKGSFIQQAFVCPLRAQLSTRLEVTNLPSNSLHF